MVEATADHELAREYMALPPDVRAGSLCFYGYHLGRPLDCGYAPLAVVSSDEYLRIDYEGGWIVEIWNPSAFRVEGICLHVDFADRLRLSREWQGELKVERDHVLTDEGLVAVMGDGSPNTWAKPREPAMVVV